MRMRVMRFVSVRVTVAGLLVTGLGGVMGRSVGAAAVAANVGGAPNYAAERAASAKELTEPYGWFSLVALEWLKPGMTTVGSAKGNSVVLPEGLPEMVMFEQAEGKVTVRAAAQSVLYRGQPVARGLVISDGEGDDAALSSGTVRMWVINRGGKRYLRVKDAKAPALKGFHGLRWYAPDAAMRVTARWVPYDGAHTMQVMNKLGQITPVAVPGYVEFTMDGTTQRLTPMTADHKRLFFVFRDATYRVDTDGGGRFLEAAPPSNGLKKAGTVVLDFNEASNPPCAYSPYATCPLAAPENRLAVAVRAGEKRYEN